MMKKLLLILVVFVGLLGIVGVSVAKYTAGDLQKNLKITADKTGVEQTDLETAAGSIAGLAFLTIGIIFFIFVFFAGFRWMVARDNEETATKAKNTLIGATIGLIIIVAAYAITTFVVSSLVDGNKADDFSPVNTVGDEPLGCCLNQLQTRGILVSQEPWVYCMESQATCESTTHNCLADDNYWKINWEFDPTITDTLTCIDAVREKNGYND